MIENQIGELTPEWENDQSNVDLSKRIAKLWEERLEYKNDEETLQGAIWYYDHVNKLVNGSDPAVARKLSDLHFKHTDLALVEQEAKAKEIEDWLASGGEQHEEAPQYREELAQLQQSIVELKQQRSSSMIEESKRRVERNPTDLVLRFELGERLLEAGNIQDAIPELQRAKQNPSVRLKAMSMLGRCFVQKNMFDMAAGQFQSAVSEMTAMDTVKKDTLYELALVYEKMGKKDDYLRCLKEIIEVDYGYKDAAQRVESSYGG
jgi:tetratricopeptide (TPR) repeat protein